MNCPDCGFTVKDGATKCRCGWTKPAPGGYVVAGEPQPICRTAGCREPAICGKALCEACEQRARHEVSEAFCRANGLETVEQKREFCKRMARGVFRGASYEAWKKNMTQRTVDLIVINGGPSNEHCLERLRAAGVIDGANKLIPLEGREIAADAYRAERARLICEQQAELEARGIVEADAGGGG